MSFILMMLIVTAAVSLLQTGVKQDEYSLKLLYVNEEEEEKEPAPEQESQVLTIDADPEPVLVEEPIQEPISRPIPKPTPIQVPEPTPQLAPATRPSLEELAERGRLRKQQRDFDHRMEQNVSSDEAVAMLKKIYGGDGDV